MATLAKGADGTAVGISGGCTEDGGREASLSGAELEGAEAEEGAVETTEGSDAGMSREMILGGGPRTAWPESRGWGADVRVSAG